jgi:hypothetical protein
LPKHTTDEYKCLRGAGDFHILPNVILSCDCTILIIGKPVKDESLYFRVNKDKHCLIFFTGVDGFGFTRLIIGPLAGGCTEQQLLFGSCFYEKIGEYVFLSMFLSMFLASFLARFLKPEDRFLYDCGLGHGDVHGVFLAPTHGSKTHSKTIQEKLYNALVRKARNIVEHSYGRTKNKWPRLKFVRVAHHRVGALFVTCKALGNIDQRYDNPLRYTSCEKKHCPYCDAQEESESEGEWE